MDYMRILRRAWEITRIYPALWVFGILLALTSAKSGGGGGSGYRFSQPSRGFNGQFPVLPYFNITPQAREAAIGVGIVLACVILLLIVALLIVRYVSANALIRMTNGYAASGEKVSVGAGFRLGWSNSAFRLFLVDLLLVLAFIISLLVLGLVAAAPLLLLRTSVNVLGVIGVILSVILGILIILLLFIAVVAAALAREVTQRSVVLESLGVMDGIRRGIALVRRHLKDVVIMGLIMFGLAVAFVVLIIPVFLLLGALGVLVGGLPALLAGLVTSLFARGGAPVVVALLVGLPFFLIVVLLPLLLVSGVYQTFSSNVWTLTYRELIGLETPAVE